MRRLGLMACILALLAGAAAFLAAGGVAQAPTPTLTITLSPGSVTAEPTAVAPGPTRVVFRNAARPAQEGVLLALRPGRTIADLRSALARTARGPGPLKAVVTFEAGGLPALGDTYASTIDLRPGMYVAAAIGENAARAPLTEITVTGEPSGAARPEPAASVEMFDYAFGTGGVLPRQGVIRMTNRGERLHFAAAFPLRRGANRTTALRALLANRERAFNRVADVRRGTELIGVVSGGTVNDVEFTFPRAGNWVLACFISDGEPGNPPHNTIGMVRAFTVR